MLDILGLVFEIIFLVIGIYLYLFSRGLITTKDPKLKQRAEAFRKENATWMRLLSLVLVAVMSVNIIVHIWQLFQ